jgi:chromosome segregation ATPase
MDLNKDMDLVDEFFSYVKNFNNKISEIKRSLNDFVNKEEFNNQLKALKEELENVEKILDNYKEILNEDLLDKIRYLNDLKLKVDVLENNQKNFVDYSAIVNIKSKINKLELDINSLSNKITKYEDVINSIKELRNIIENSIDRLNKIEDSYTNINDFNDLKTKVDNLTNLVSKTIDNLSKDLLQYNKISEMINEIKEKDLYNISSKLEEIEKKYEEKYSEINNKISNMNYLLQLTDDDVKNIKQFKAYEELYNKYINFENRLNSIYALFEELNNLVVDLRSRINEMDKIEEINEKYNKLEESLNDIKEEMRKIKTELYDSKDILESVLSDYENLMNKIKKIESFIDLSNFEYIINEIEKIKILENDIENIKRLLLSKNIKEEENYKY